MFNIRLAETVEDLEALYRFRYQIYVEEMGRVQHDADHDLKMIQDDLDVNGSNLIAFKSGQLVGAARINLNENISDFYNDFYKIKDQKGTNKANISIVTRLMVAKEFRKSTLALRIFIACYEFGLWRGTQFNFVDCNDHLIDFFKSFGYEHYIKKINHKEYGLVNPLILDLHDESHFRALKSPFLNSFLKWKESQLMTA